MLGLAIAASIGGSSLVMRWYYVIVLLASLGLAREVTAASTLASHQAFYDLSLIRADQGSGIENVDGRIAIEWSRQCDGYILNQRVLMRVTATQGNSTVSDYRVAAWESLDGARFRFSLRNEVNGKVVESFDGKARLEGVGGAGEASFTAPKKSTLALPKGTLFPTAHVRAILEAANTGQRTLARLTFDGSDPDYLVNAFAVISGVKKTTPENLKAFASLEGLRHWPVRIGYFKHKKSAGTPEVELGMTLFENGVIGRLVLDYGEFTVAGALIALKPIEVGGC